MSKDRGLATKFVNAVGPTKYPTKLVEFTKLAGQCESVVHRVLYIFIITNHSFNDRRYRNFCMSIAVKFPHIYVSINKAKFKNYESDSELDLSIESRRHSINLSQWFLEDVHDNIERAVRHYRRLTDSFGKGGEENSNKTQSTNTQDKPKPRCDEEASTFNSSSFIHEELKKIWKHLTRQDEAFHTFQADVNKRFNNDDTAEQHLDVAVETRDVASKTYFVALGAILITIVFGCLAVYTDFVPLVRDNSSSKNDTKPIPNQIQRMIPKTLQPEDVVGTNNKYAAFQLKSDIWYGCVTRESANWEGASGKFQIQLRTFDGVTLRVISTNRSIGITRNRYVTAYGVLHRVLEDEIQVKGGIVVSSHGSNANPCPYPLVNPE